MAQENPDNLLQLGKLGKTFQLAGGLRFYPLGDAEAEAIFSLPFIYLGGFGKTEIREVKEQGKDIILYLTAALTVEKARALVNCDVYAPADLLPETDDFYLDDLIGLAVFLEGQRIGEIESVLEAGMQDILTISGDSGDFMVPLQAPYVSLEEDGLYLNDLPEGLLDLNDA
ncbi:MAG: 16S rRNA processing protein RimM [Trueperaceae bacterium]|nr:16S rRNA processing protein RimM [Trueperaceae bacterium]